LPPDHARVGGDVSRGLGLHQREGRARAWLPDYTPQGGHSPYPRLAASAERRSMIPRQTPPSTGGLVRSADRKATIVLISAPLLGILLVYLGSKLFYFRHLASSFVLGGNKELTAGSRKIG